MATKKLKLADMKNPPRSKSAERIGMVAEPKGPDYPYGLRLELNTQSLKKLGITELPGIDDTYAITAVAKVVSVRSNEDRDERGPRHSVSLQITRMGVK